MSVIQGEFLFLYPWVLLLLLGIPCAVWWILVHQRRYWHDAFEFSQISVLKTLRRNRHVILHQRVLPLLLLLSLSSGIIGLAQPAFKTRVPMHNSYLMLVLDISVSMEATDLSPSRLAVARNAAIDFVKTLPDDVKLGLEFFAGNNYLVSPPIEDHKLIIEYLKSLRQEDLRPGTAMGDALIVAIESLQATILAGSSAKPESNGMKASKQHQGTVILLTDGENNLGISPLQSADQAARQKITVFTIGMGEETGAYVRGGIFTHLDEATLQAIAQQTGGSYYRARSFKDFGDIYRKIGQKTLVYEEKTLGLMPWLLGLSTFTILLALFWMIRCRRF